MDKLSKSPETRIFQADFIKEIKKEIDDVMPKARTLRALKHHISEEKAEVEIFEEISSKLIAIVHALNADKMTIENENELKILLFEIESYALDVVQKAKNIELQHITNRIREEGGTLLRKMVVVLEALEKYSNINMGKSSIQEIRNLSKDAFNFLMDVILNERTETAEVQQITEIELD